MEILGVITARAGSKTIPRKNLRLLAGQPLITYTCEVARAAGRLTRTIISTDSREIADVCRATGVEAPFIRPVELAQDNTIGVVPLLHAVEWLMQHEDYSPDCVVLLQPTSPLREAQDIDGAVDLLLRSKAAAVVGVTPVEVHPYWMKQVDDQNRMINMTPVEKADDNRQNLPPVYAVNGAIYVIRRPALLSGRSLFPPDTRVWIMPPERALDVNTPWEMHLVDLVLKDRMQNAQKNPL